MWHRPFRQEGLRDCFIGIVWRHKTVIFASHNLHMSKLCFLSVNEPKLLLPKLRINQQAAMPLSAACLAAFYLGWVILQWPQLHEPILDVAQTDANVPNEAAETRDFLQIAEWRLMGTADTVEEVADAELAPTPLQLKLLGTFYLPRQPQNNYAVIQSSDGQQRKYRVGEELPEGAVLQAVEHSRVVLKHNQRLEYLQFEANPLALTKSADQSTQ